MDICTRRGQKTILKKNIQISITKIQHIYRLVRIQSLFFIGERAQDRKETLTLYKGTIKIM